MQKATIYKKDVLHKHPDIFAKLVWVQDMCVVSILEKGKTHTTVSSAGTMELLDIPNELLK